MRGWNNMEKLDVFKANERIKELFEEYGPYFELPEDEESKEIELKEYCEFLSIDRPKDFGDFGIRFEEFLDWYYNTYTYWEIEHSKLSCVYDSCGLDIYVLSYELIGTISKENYPVFNLVYYRR